MKLHDSTKGFLFGIMFSIFCVMIIGMLSGCTTTEKQQVIDRISSEVKDKLNDEDTKGDDNLGGTGTEDIKTEETKQETKVEDKNVEGSNFGNISELIWSEKGDECHIVQCYFGDGHDSELFKLAAQLPIDFACTLDNGGVHITKPASDDTAWMTMYEGDHMQKRRAFVCMFNEVNELVKCEDWAEGPDLDNRWKDKGAVKGFVVHCKHGKAVSRTALTEVK